MAKFILDTRLSRAQWYICKQAIRKGVITAEDLNEGKRTMAEQWHFWNNQPPLAAFPSPFAPHIKKGVNNHAIDCNSLNGASQRLAKFYRSLGVPVAFNVDGEPWHFDVLSHWKVRAAALRIKRSWSREERRQEAARDRRRKRRNRVKARARARARKAAAERGEL